MKLYNRSLLPDAVLHPVLVKAGRLAGARTQRVVVRVNGNWRNRETRGVAPNYYWVSKDWLQGRKQRRNGPTVITDGGMIEMWVGLRTCLDCVNGNWAERAVSTVARELANSFFAVAIHEWKHITDYQNGEVFSGYGQVVAGGRRPKWGKRPEEIRAQDTVNRVLAKGTGLELFPEVVEPLVAAIETILLDALDAFGK